jgi:signal transduction histidine kinase
MSVSTSNGGTRVLVVDDDDDIRGSLSDLLREDGFEVEGAADGDQALARLRAAPVPDLILLDLVMPVKDGWQFRTEQRQDPSIAAIPVVAMSADDSAKAAAIDADHYLKKPFDYPILLETVRRVVDKKRLAHLDRMASLGTLAAGIAHEINNPLTYVIANLQLVQEELPSVFQSCLGPASTANGDVSGAINRLSELGARLRDALEGAERIRRIVSHVQMFSRAADEHRSALDVRSVIDASLKVVFTEIRQRAQLVKEYGHVPLVVANAGQLGQVFLNLLLNAAHAIPENDAQRHVIRVETSTSSSGDAVVTISDTGPGIPADIQHRIFDPFFSTKPLGVGTGLGLSICHGIVRSLDGTIVVESEPGSGCTFRITLPAAAQPRSAGPSYRPSTPSLRRARVLIVDDEPRVANAVQAMIEGEYETVVATGGLQALSLLESDPPEGGFDVILCDLHMPGVSGMELFERLAKIRPAVAERIVFMTGGAFTERARDFVASTANACIDKPIDRHGLRALLSSRLGGGDEART